MIEFVASWQFVGGFMAGMAAGGIGAVVAIALCHAASAWEHYPDIEDAEEPYRPSRNVEVR